MSGRRFPALLLLLAACSSSPASRGGPAAAAPARGIVPSYERLIDAIPAVDDSGRAFAFPFLGGSDRPRPQLVDIDGDGDLDLFVQEYTGRMSFFEREGTAAGGRYVWRTDAYEGLDIGEWSRFVDMDGDGDLDLFAESPFSYIRVFENTGTAERAVFRVAADTLRDAAGTPIFADRQNIPQLADLDCDRRLDLMLGRVDGTITRYEAVGDPGGVPRFALVTDRYEGIQIIGDTPSLHGANTMAISDVDGDGDMDILWGDFFEPGILWIRNNGSCAAPAMRDEPIPYPVGAPLRTSGYNAPVTGDVDGDGDADLLVGVLGGAFDPSKTSRDNLYLLERTGAEGYRTVTTRYLDGLDIGSEAVPALVDLDGDGDLDLVAGNKIDPGVSRTGSLFRFENTGTAEAPRFRPAGTIPVDDGYHFAPAFGDLDGDGDPDLVLGTWRDALLLYRNEGGAREPRFAKPDTLVRLTRGSHATPALADMDGDGDLDLFVGEGSGALNYYRNDGTAAAPRYELVSDEYAGIRAGRRSVPRPVDLDGDGDFDLLVGTESGRTAVVENTGTRTAPALTWDSTATLAWPAFGAAAPGDLDGDGDVDLIVGTGSGGFVHLRNAGH